MLLKHEDMLFNNGGGGESNGISPLHKAQPENTRD